MKHKFKAVTACYHQCSIFTVNHKNKQCNAVSTFAACGRKFASLLQNELTGVPPAGVELKVQSEVGSNLFLRAMCFGLRSLQVLLLWEHSDARLMLSLTAIPATHF